MTMRAAVELNVFNIIARSGPGAHLSSREIISQIPTTNPTAAVDNLDRILKFLSSHSLLSTSTKLNPIDQTKQEKCYGLTHESSLLVPNEDGVSWAPIVMFQTEMMVVKSLNSLKYAILEPESTPFFKVHGETLYEYMSNKPEVSQIFDKVMALNHYYYLNDKMFEVYKGFEEVKELMDVGGGDGTAVARIVSQYPHIRGINFNLPSVISHAPNLKDVEHVCGDMFESIPKTQSIMLMLVLHNWDDDQCKKILKHCWEALPENGKVIVIDHFVMPEADDQDTPEIKRAQYLDIFMLGWCPGGKERTTIEYDNIAKSVGFVETKIFPLPQGSCVIEFLKDANV